MHPLIQGMGWYVRRSRPPMPLGEFYHKALGLPVIRNEKGHLILWAGEAVAFEVLPGGTPPGKYESHTDALSIPVFRSYDLATTVDRAVNAGARILSNLDHRYGQIVYMTDTDGYVFGAQERRPGSNSREDKEAQYRWENGHTRIEGLPSLPSEIQNLGWVVWRVPDPRATIAFLNEIVGLEMLPETTEGWNWLDLGDTSALIVVSGGTDVPPPADRAEVSDAILFRVHNMDALVPYLREHNVHFVNEPMAVAGGSICYVAVPGGRLIGFFEREPSENHPEDTEAYLRWNQGVTV